MKALSVVLGLLALGWGACASETANQEGTAAGADPQATAAEAAEGGTDPEVRRYRVRSGMVTYTLSGVQNGTETLYFDQWGMREAKHTQAEIGAAGITVQQNQLVVMADGWTTTVDLNRKTGSRIPTPLMPELIETAKREGGDMTDIGEAMMTRMGAVKVGTETLLGKPCDIWEIQQMNSKTWVWQGITLKTEVRMGGQTVLIEATEVQDNIDVPEERFTIPADVQVVEGTNPLEGLRNLPGQQQP